MAVSKKPFKVAGKASYYYKLDGRRLSLSTHDYAEACRLLRSVKEAYLEGKVSRITGESGKTLGQFAREYLDWAYETQAIKTFKANRLALRKILHIEGDSVRLDRLTLKTMDELKRTHKKLQASSVNNYIRHAKVVISKAVDWGYLQTNPFKKAKELPQSKRVAFIDPKDISAFLRSIEDLDLRRFIAACLATGRRRSEVFRLTWADILWEQKRYFVAKEKRHLNKTYPMNDALVAVLKSMPIGQGRIFKKWSHPDTYTHKAKEALKAAGYGHLRLHDLRHSFSVAFLDAGGDIKSLQDALGHSEFRTTSDTYAHITDASLAASVNLVKLGPVDLFSKS